MGKTAILGFGNPVRSDDGVGCRVIDLLRPHLQGQEEITLLDMGTSAFEVLFQLQGHSRILLVDGVINSGEPDGTLYRLPAEAVEASIQDDPMVFLHSLKWDQALSYARKILRNDYPEDVTVFLVSITETRLAEGLSTPVSDAAGRVAGLILAEVAPSLLPAES